MMLGLGKLFVLTSNHICEVNYVCLNVLIQLCSVLYNEYTICP